MKKLYIFILVIIIVIILFPKPMGYSGGFTGGTTYFKHCVGYVGTKVSKGPPIPDGVDSSTYCMGIPFN